MDSEFVRTGVIYAIEYIKFQRQSEQENELANKCAHRSMQKIRNSYITLPKEYKIDNFNQYLKIIFNKAKELLNEQKAN